MYKEVELSDGRVVKVHAPPGMKILKMVQAMYPDPEKKVEVVKTASGREERILIEDDPEYLAECERVEALRDAKTEELNNLFTFKDLEVPKGWDVETEYGEMIRYTNPDWKPREGVVGRKLDYIEWDLLASAGDLRKVQMVMYEVSGLNLEAANQMEATFRGDVEGQADRALAEPGPSEEDGW